MSRLRRATPEQHDIASDEELVRRTQRGDRAAFGGLYDRYLPLVYNYCHRMLGEREAAEDATMDIFMRALAALPAYRAHSFRSWLFTIAHNVITDAWRKRRPTVSLEQAATIFDPVVFEEAAVSAADWERVQLVFSHLSVDQRHVVVLRLTGLNAAEIGETLGKPRNAVDGLYHRALLRLRSLVATNESAVSNEHGGG